MRLKAAIAASGRLPAAGQTWHEMRRLAAASPSAKVNWQTRNPASATSSGKHPKVPRGPTPGRMTASRRAAQNKSSPRPTDGSAASNREEPRGAEHEAREPNDCSRAGEPRNRSARVGRSIAESCARPDTRRGCDGQDQIAASSEQCRPSERRWCRAARRSAARAATELEQQLFQRGDAGAAEASSMQMIS